MKSYRLFVVIGLLPMLALVQGASTSTSTVPEMRVQLGCAAVVNSVAFSPDGRLALSGLEDKTMRLWDVASGKEIRAFTGFTEPVKSVTFSPDGRYALSVAKFTQQLWDLNSGEMIRTYPGSADIAIFSPNGQYVVTTAFESSQFNLRLLDVASGAVAKVFPEKFGIHGPLAFSPDGRYLVAADKENLQLLDIAGNKIIKILPDHAHYILTVAFSPDSRYIASGGIGREIKLWDVIGGKEVKTRAHFSGHEGSVRSLAFSPDGRYILSGADDNTVKLWDASSGRNLRTFTGHSDGVLSVAFSPDGRYALSGSKDNAMILWDVRSGKRVINFLRNVAAACKSVSFSPDGRYALLGFPSDSLNDTIILWDVAVGKAVKKFAPIFGGFDSICFFPDGRRILDGSSRILALWDLDSGKRIDIMSTAGQINSAVVSPDGKYILAGLANNSVELWDITNCRKLKTFTGHTKPVTSVAFSPDGRYALSGSDDKTITVWDIVGGQGLWSFYGHTDAVLSVAFSPDGRYALSGSADKTMRLYDVVNGEEVHTLWKFLGHTGGISSATFSPDGRYILSGSHDNTARLWDVANGEEIAVFSGHSTKVNSVAFSPDGRYALTCSDDTSIKLWNVKTRELIYSAIIMPKGEDYLVWTPEGYMDGGEQAMKNLAYLVEGTQVILGDQLIGKHHRPEMIKAKAAGNSVPIIYQSKSSNIQAVTDVSPEIKVRMGHVSGYRVVAFSPDGRYALSGGWGKLILWDVQSGKEIILSEHMGITHNIIGTAFSPDGRYALSSSKDWLKNLETIRLWDITKRKEIKSFPGYSSRLLVFSPDGRYVLLNNMVVLNISNGKAIRIASEKFESTSAAFSPDGRYALSNSNDNILILWDMRTGTQVKSFSGHENEITSVAYSPDGRYALSGSLDKTIRLWNIAEGKEIRIFKGHLDGVTTVTFSPDGQSVLSGSRDKEIKLWNISTNKEIKTFVGHHDLIETIIFCPNGKYMLSASSEDFPSDDITMIMWDTRTGKAIKIFGGYIDHMDNAALTSDGKYAFTSGQYGRLWDITNFRMKIGFSAFISSYSEALTSDGRYVLTHSDKDDEERIYLLWDAINGKKIKSIAIDHYFSVAAISPDGHHLLTVSEGNVIKLWDITSGKVSKTLTGHSGNVSSVAFSPDGRYGLSGSGDKTVKLWDLTNGKEIVTLVGHLREIESVVFSHDGRYALSGGFGQVKLWDISSYKEIRTLNLNNIVANSLTFSNDDRFALVDTIDNSIMIWDMFNNDRSIMSSRHSDSIFSITCTPDARFVLSGSKDATMKLWNFKTGELIYTIIAARNERDYLVWTPEGFFDGTEWAINNLVYMTYGDKIIEGTPLIKSFHRPDLIKAKLEGKDISGHAKEIRDEFMRNN